MNAKDNLNNILILNLGSSTVKGSLYETLGKEITLTKQFSKKNFETKNIKSFLAKILNPKINVIVFRVVHGGKNYPSPMILTEKVLAGIREGEKLAPIHNSIMLQWYQEIKEIIKDKLLCLACFDTSFFYKLPKISKTYPIPLSISRKYNIQKLGFHGFAHQSMLVQLEKYLGRLPGKKRIITLQLGGGSSITASLNGKPIETSMGFSPLEGLMMSTRSGSIDPGIIIYLLKSGFPIGEIETMLNYQSGLKALAGTSDYQELMQQDTKESRFAIDLYCRDIVKYLGAYITILGGVDAIVFGGGIGENCHITRQKIISYFRYLGIEIQNEANQKKYKNFKMISSQNSLVGVYVIKPDEEYEMINAVQNFLS